MSTAAVPLQSGAEGGNEGFVLITSLVGGVKTEEDVEQETRSFEEQDYEGSLPDPAQEGVETLTGITFGRGFEWLERRTVSFIYFLCFSITTFRQRMCL